MEDSDGQLLAPGYQVDSRKTETLIGVNYLQILWTAHQWVQYQLYEAKEKPPKDAAYESKRKETYYKWWVHDSLALSLFIHAKISGNECDFPLD